MSKIAVELSRVSKKYVLHHEKPTLVENILKRKALEEFWALKDISFNVKRGEQLGIIGPNGSGKTTLLKIIAGITAPSTGKVNTYGKVVSLIELSAGFQPDLTGEENMMLNGLLIGMSKEEINSKIDEVVKFADIGKFIDAPFYTYSSGMALRLGFSIAVHADPDILILDENLAVGDQNFRKKSFEKIQSFFKQNKTIILVSHSLDFLESGFNRVIWIDRGEVKMDGKAKQIIKFYKQSLK